MSSSVIQKVFHAFLHRPIQIKFCFILFKALDLEPSLHADFIGLKKMSSMELVLTFSHRRQFAVFKSAFSKPTSKVLFERNQNTSVVHCFVKY